jgi:hypothetical protein
MKTIKGLLSISLLLISLSAFCQDDTLKHSPVQVSFVFPLGIHGIYSVNHSYDFSFNILTGNTGSIDGFELGGLLNMNRGDISGFQVAGLGNITQGNVSGLQVGGLFSLGENLNGMQVSGIFGKTSESHGLQVAGIVNVSDAAKSSIAGITNINKGSQKGFQIAGIYNQTKEMNGVQIALINRSDTISNGVPIGLINLIKKGYYDEWVLSFADYMNLGISYKLGLKNLYTIYSLGMNIIEDQLWVGGIGIGHLHEVNPKFAIQPEIMLYTYFPMDFERRIRETNISHFKLGLVYRLNRSMALSLAPSIYLAWKSNRNIYDVYGYEQSFIGPLFDVERAYNDRLMEFGFGLSMELHFSPRAI